MRPHVGLLRADRDDVVLREGIGPPDVQPCRDVEESLRDIQGRDEIHGLIYGLMRLDPEGIAGVREGVLSKEREVEAGWEEGGDLDRATLLARQRIGGAFSDLEFSIFGGLIGKGVDGHHAWWIEGLTSLVARERDEAPPLFHIAEEIDFSPFGSAPKRDLGGGLNFSPVLLSSIPNRPLAPPTQFRGDAVGESLLQFPIGDARDDQLGPRQLRDEGQGA
jgi:hypothetical protein